MYSWDNAQVVLVGNKSDLEQDRAVVQERGQRLADQLGKFYLNIYISILDVRFNCLFRVCLGYFVLCCVLKGFTDKITRDEKNTVGACWK
jgi:hypothetical protein